MFAFTLLLLISVTYCKSEHVKCKKHNFTFVHDGKNAEDYCKLNKCMAKCCPQGEYLVKGNVCARVPSNVTLDYSKILIHKTGDNNKPEASNNMTMEDFKFVYDPKFLDKNCSQHKEFDKVFFFYIMEDGSRDKYKTRNSTKENWVRRHKNLEYCVELLSHNGTTIRVYFALDTLDIFKDVVDKILKIGTLVSFIFAALTLVVYCLLPYLRNINGMIQMAYVGGLMVMFILKFIIFDASSEHNCFLTPLYYFYVISNFLWLAVMSFNIWWTFRGTIHHRSVHRRGELMKFFIYCLCVYGTTGALTIFAVVVDNVDQHVIEKPGLKLCLPSSSQATTHYMYIPIAILIGINCVLFVMTLYNIWKIKRGLEAFNSSETRKNQVGVNSFKVYVKISLMMGVSWILEVSQINILELKPIYNLLLNFLNAYRGLIIFLVLVCDKKLIGRLLQRFNIQNKWVKNSLKPNSPENTSSTKKSSKTDGASFRTVELSSFKSVG